MSMISPGYLYSLHGTPHSTFISLPQQQPAVVVVVVVGVVRKNSPILRLFDREAAVFVFGWLVGRWSRSILLEHGLVTTTVVAFRSSNPRAMLMPLLFSLKVDGLECCCY